MAAATDADSVDDDFGAADSNCVTSERGASSDCGRVTVDDGWTEEDLWPDSILWLPVPVPCGVAINGERVEVEGEGAEA